MFRIYMFGVKKSLWFLLFYFAPKSFNCCMPWLIKEKGQTPQLVMVRIVIQHYLLFWIWP